MTETSRSEMSSGDVVELLRLLETSGVEVYVDGGWGVDALLGEQTRPHSDLDIWGRSSWRHERLPFRSWR
jgi:lincosamide nucleotidyltransferase A/C/D/E